ncbi:hypothetical protein H8A99_19055 [Bradyrhizobium sp. Arg68]|uniref:hypothetical protein n=1 Tax=Bradyrhizobium ivorense TaxID=2511166 RepID=UPI001E4A6D4A|nr:hypothetical protein [Bradyrhizobium ivorense]MCC8938516.1 hypothetical protein [Bradyrhizobium ivorense]
MTYPALRDEAQRILGGLKALERFTGSKVALLLERPADFIPAFWECVFGGYSPCPLASIRGDNERPAAQLSRAETLLDHPLIVTSRELHEELPDLPGLTIS